MSELNRQDLVAAKLAHKQFEDVAGQPDPDWETWYARFLNRRLSAKDRVRELAIGIVARPGSLWLGAHWSKYNRRLCLNLLPMVTIWFALPGGVPGTGWRLL